MAFYSQITHLPILVKASDKLAQETEEAVMRFKDAASVRDRVAAMTDLIKLGQRIGNIFAIIWQEKRIALHPGAITYIQSLLHALANNGKVNDVCFSDRLMLLSVCESTVYSQYSWKESELAIIQELALLPEEELVGRFAVGPGVDKYVELLHVRTSM